MDRAGVEPARPNGHTALNGARMPVPPPVHPLKKLNRNDRLVPIPNMQRALVRGRHLSNFFPRSTRKKIRAIENRKLTVDLRKILI